MNDKILSYHNDNNLKKLVITEMKNHQKEDKFIKGSYGFYEGGEFKGCAVACAVNSVNKILGKDYDTKSHGALQETLGIPGWLSKIQETFFECLPWGECDKFAIDFLEAIPVGVDLEPIRWKICTLLLKEGIEILQDKENLIQDIKEEALEALRHSLMLYEGAIKSNSWNYEFSNLQIKKLERLALKSIIHFPRNISHIVNIALKSIKVDEDSMHRMFFSSTAGSCNGRLSTEAIETSYAAHAYQLLNLLKNSGDNNASYH
jgi:hypothetical protein